VADSAGRRAVLSFYAGSGPDAAGVSVCRGLSCELHGGSEIAARQSSRGPCRDIYCLGYCDRSPAILGPDAQVRAGAQANAWATSGAAAPSLERPDIRSVARRPVVTERIALGSHASLNKARQAGVYAGLARALVTPPESLLAAVDASGEQGRGGAGYPTGAKWRAAAAASGAMRYVIANGDEGDPGSFIDRVLLEDDPHAIIEGLLLCGYAVGASEAIVFIRAEYPLAQARMTQAIVEAREAGLLGPSVMGYPFAFDVRVVSGHGSYVCGEETALLNAIEYRRGEVRVRPPYPVTAGLHGQPTVVNNVETLVNIPWILREGPQAYRELGTRGSPGTKAFCLNRGFARPGIVEAEFGLSLDDLIGQHAGGGAVPLRAVLLGGPMGSLLRPSEWDIVLDYPVLRARGVQLGHGGVVAIPATANLRDLLLHAAQFMAAESCGKCVPCGTGSGRVLELARRLRESTEAAANPARELAELLRLIQATSLCGFGQGVPGPMLSLVTLALSEATHDGHGHG
jgi:NADH:ubiquinone oxidoreductase subunit F (NADH-binding)